MKILAVLNMKNAQDGISMIQTYEGALTETDSILQRMKTLATQAANGTYQDDVDRDAIQLEFDQLNDELNQIADTDFNGVVVLNGGEMADGTKAINGKFDYENGSRLKKQLGSVDIKTLDNKGWNSTNADTAWSTWSGSIFDRTDADRTNDGPASTDITFKYNSVDGTWSAISATNGMDVDAIDACVVNSTKRTGTPGTANNGGFSLTDGVNEVANIVVDTSTLQNGDTITLTFANPLASKTTPENVGVKKDSIDTSNFNAGVDTTDAAKTADATDVTIEFGASISSTNDSKTTFITEDQDKLYKLLDGATVKATYINGAPTATGYELTLSDGTSVTSAATNGTAFIIGGTTFYAIGTAGTAGTDGGSIEINTAKDGSGDTLFKFTGATGYNNTGTGNSATSGSVTYTLSVAQSKFDESGLMAEVKEPEGSNVSNANAYTQASAPLTYTDHIILQAGARTKDAVDFTFKYSSGGLGDLKANMNCSAREDGLGTASLKLTNQKDANYAIDRIDNAINKVSMVRATFGAVQNRLEHKIDNMNVTKENITSAESRIRDTNMAEEMTNFTKNQILSQASQAMLAQANQLPQGVLQLLG